MGNHSATSHLCVRERKRERERERIRIRMVQACQRPSVFVREKAVMSQKIMVTKITADCCSPLEEEMSRKVEVQVPAVFHIWGASLCPQYQSNPCHLTFLWPNTQNTTIRSGSSYIPVPLAVLWWRVGEDEKRGNSNNNNLQDSRCRDQTCQPKSPFVARYCTLPYPTPKTTV